MGNTQDIHSGPAEAKDKTQDPIEETVQSTRSTSERQPSYNPRSSMESTATATTLPPYSQYPDRPPKYNDAGIYSNHPNPSNESTPRAKRVSQPVSAASVNAVMATSSSSNDRMHSQPSSSRRVENWNEDPSYKSKLSSTGGSSRKWNYFGADIGGNPFRRSWSKK